MHRRLLNTARLAVQYTPRGPVLIKSGIDTPDPTRPEMEFVRQRHPTVGDTVYLPGTSLKGVVRSHAERILRGVGVAACDPFDDRSACRTAHGNSTAQIFAEQCPVCRTFGSLKIAGRCSLSDALPWRPEATDSEMADEARVANRTERRSQVAISRRTGSTQGGALFDLEVVVSGAFHGEIHLRNFQLWQLALLGVVLADLDEGRQRVGFGKSRGLGFVAVQIEKIRIEFARSDSGHVLGSGALASPEEVNQYGLFGDDIVPLPSGVAATTTWRGTALETQGKEAVHSLLQVAVDGPLAKMVAGAVKKGA